MSFSRKMARQARRSKTGGRESDVGATGFSFYPKDEVHAQGIEWIGGYICNDVGDDCEEADAILIVWVRPDGELVGACCLTLNELVEVNATRFLMEAMVRPLVGLRQAPCRIRFQTEAGAKLFRMGVPRGAEIVVHPDNREMDPITTTIRGILGGEPTHGEASFALPPLAETAFRLRSVNPWRRFSGGEAVIVVAPKLQAIHFALIAVDDPFGRSVQLFPSPRNAADFLRLRETDRGGPIAGDFPRVVLSFNRLEAIPAPFRAATTDPGWEQDGSPYIPWIGAADPGEELRLPTAHERSLIEVVAFVLALALEANSGVHLNRRPSLEHHLSARVQVRLPDGTTTRVALGVPRAPLNA